MRRYGKRPGRSHRLRAAPALDDPDDLYTPRLALVGAPTVFAALPAAARIVRDDTGRFAETARERGRGRVTLARGVLVRRSRDLPMTHMTVLMHLRAPKPSIDPPDAPFPGTVDATYILSTRLAKHLVLSGYTQVTITAEDVGWYVGALAPVSLMPCGVALSLRARDPAALEMIVAIAPRAVRSAAFWPVRRATIARHADCVFGWLRTLDGVEVLAEETLLASDEPGSRAEWASPPRRD